MGRLVVFFSDSPRDRHSTTVTRLRLSLSSPVSVSPTIAERHVDTVHVDLVDPSGVPSAEPETKTSERSVERDDNPPCNPPSSVQSS